MLQRFFISLLFSLLLLPAAGWAQVYCSAESQARLERHLQALSESPDLAECDMGTIAITVGQRLLGLPYVGKTLEKPGPEQLVIELEGLDCTTFLENVVVLGRLVKLQELTPEAFQRELQLLRYRQGELKGYPSRLHYFSDWLHDNQQKGLLTDITAEIGGQSYPKTIDFMGTHRSAYAALADDDYYAAMLGIEEALNQRTRYYIPQEEVSELEHHIRDGDLIAITTTIEGLDISHVGLAIHHQGRLHLLHASTDAQRVVVSERPLAEYLLAHRSQSGILVARLQDPS